MQAFQSSCFSRQRNQSSAFSLLDYFYRHVTEFCVDSAAAPQRPPIVKIDLHRPPHGNPTSNREALTQHGGPSARVSTQQHVADDETSREKCRADEKTRTALVQEALEVQATNLGAVSEVVVDRLS